jgi:hypothetical protein
MAFRYLFFVTTSTPGFQLQAPVWNPEKEAFEERIKQSREKVAAEKTE